MTEYENEHLKAVNTSHIRINNIILCNGKPEVITGVLQYGVYFAFGYCPNVKDSNGKPLLEFVPLTEKWLFDFGYEMAQENGDHGVYDFPFPDINHKTQIIGDSNGYWWFNGYGDGLLIESVHHLQNLYFEIEKRELKPILHPVVF